MLDKKKNIFIVGIKGVAMANIAVILKKMGKNVSGSDTEEDFITDELLRRNSIKVTTGFDPDDLPDETDLLLFGPAHGGSINPQVQKATKKSQETKTQAEFLGELLKAFQTSIAVCGSHGKTTTTSLLSYGLLQLGTRPSYIAGTSNFKSKDKEYSGGDFQDNDYFVIEADEYGVNPPSDKTPKFLYLNPDIILCTNVDFDHPDIYADIREVEIAFLAFFKKAKKILLCADDPISLRLSKKIARERVETYGFSSSSDLQISNYSSNEDFSEFTVSYKGGSAYVCLGLFGGKNASNTAGVILTLINCGFSLKDAAKAVEWFVGPKRRFEQVDVVKDTYLFDDYAHHPQEIEATIIAARERFAGRRIGVIFQPHTYSRTAAFTKEFAQALSKADYALIAPIFASARENPKSYKISSLDIAKYTQNDQKLQAVARVNELMPALASKLRLKDVIFTMGAGDIYRLKNDIIKALEKAK